jgi:hypothetical protein
MPNKVTDFSFFGLLLLTSREIPMFPILRKCWNYMLWYSLVFPPLVLQPNSGLGHFNKISFSLQLLDLGQSVGLLGWVISSSQGLSLYANIENAHTTQILNIHAQSAVRTHGPGVRLSEDISCFRPLGYRDRLASERAKTVHALDRSATVTGGILLCVH